MPQMPQALMCGDKAFHVSTAIGVRIDRPAGQHHFQCAKQLIGNFIIGLIAGMMKSYQNFVGKPPAMTLREAFSAFPQILG